MQPIAGFKVISNYMIKDSDLEDGYRVLKSKEELINFSDLAEVSAFATFPTDFSKKNLIVITMHVNDNITNFKVRNIDAAANQVNIIMEMWKTSNAPAPLKGVDFTFIEADKNQLLKLDVKVVQNVK